MKLRESWVRATQLLSEESVSDPAIEAEAMVRHATALDRAGFFASLNDEVAAAAQGRIDGLVERRSSGEPLFYMLGHREFYGLELYVDAAVLIPRQETELLVDLALQHCRQYAGRRLTVLDVGTGSGAIAVALACHLPSATVHATDSSREALLVADANMKRHNLSDRVHLVQTDLLGCLNTTVDVIVSNPPYIASEDIGGLADEVRQEPRSAIDGGMDGLGPTARLLIQAQGHIRPGGLVLVETDPQHIERAIQLGRDAFPDALVWYERDLLGMPRVIVVGVPPYGPPAGAITTRAVRGPALR